MITTQTYIILASFFITSLSALLTPASCLSVPPVRGVLSFDPSSSRTTTTNAAFIHHARNIKSTRINSTNKDDEIAELEAKLKQLKEEKEAAADSEVATTLTGINGESSAVATTELTNEDDAQPLDEMLSEAWKESENGVEEGGSIIPSLIGGLVLLVSFVALSQIPVGQEGLDKYSTAKPSTSIDLGDKNPASSSRIEIN